MADDPSNADLFEVPRAESAAARAHRLNVSYLNGIPSFPRRHGIGAACAGGTSLLLHALLISSAIFGARAPHARMPDERGAGASAIVSSAEPVMTLNLINEGRVDEEQREPEMNLASRGIARADLPIVALSPDALPAVESSSDQDTKTAQNDPVSTANNASNRALLFGRYMGQISARVTRAWMRPRTPIGAPVFECAVHIRQDPHGMVREVSLQRCNGDARWQQSLIEAIESASPLSGAPDASVFTETVSLDFRSPGFSPESDPHGFEAESAMPMEEAKILWSPRPGAHSDVIDLRIVGNADAAPAPTPSMEMSTDTPALPESQAPDNPPADGVESNSTP